MSSRRSFLLFSLIALLLASFIVRFFSQQPGYTDAFYHYNAAVHIAEGRGFIDEYLWTYLGITTDTLPVPSHLYWMPGTSIILAVGMTLFGIGYVNAQLGLILCLWGASLLTYGLGWRWRSSTRHAWFAGMLLLMGGFFLRVWGASDTFAPYAFFGAGALYAMGIARERQSWQWWLLAGVVSGVAHLIRSDGLILLIVAILVMSFNHTMPPSRRIMSLSVFLFAYALVMSPWFARNLTEVGTILPLGGTRAIWYAEYNDLFAYPPRADAQSFFADGIGLLLETRWWAIANNLGTLIAVQSYVIFAPFMLWSLWKRRYQPFWQAVVWFALGIHLAFTFVFPFPGVRGGLFHASAALMPFWCALSIMGLDEAVTWFAQRRKHWQIARAQPTFGLIALGVVLILSLSLALPRRVQTHTPTIYRHLQSILPQDARIMINDPSETYYHTGRGGVVLPNEDFETLFLISQRYEIDFLLLEYPDIPRPLFFDTPPDFLERLDFPIEGVDFYAIHRP